MIWNFFKIAYRSLLRHKAHSFINIAGLAIGLAACLLIFAYVQDELSYDRFHHKADRVFRVSSNMYPSDGEPNLFNTNGWPVGERLREDYPEVEAVTDMRGWPAFAIKHDGLYYYDKIMYADENFFSLFSFPVLKGDPGTALRDPYTLLITPHLEQKLFGNAGGLGKTLILGDTIQFKITGIIEVPLHSHIQFDMLASMATIKAIDPSYIPANGWTNINQFNYILLKPGVNQEAFAAKIRRMPMEHVGQQLLAMGFRYELSLQPIRDIYLKSDRGNGLGPVSDIIYVYFLSAIGLIILLIGCINFINLTTARATERSKEVGIRKVIGSQRSSLIGQFLSESFLTCLVALGGAFVIMHMALPLFNSLTDKQFTLALFGSPLLLLAVLCILLLVGLLAGTYPAFVLSSFKPIQALKGISRSGVGGLRLRQALVVAQFGISCLLIVGTLVVLGQLRYMQNKPLGFNKDQVLVLDARKGPWSVRTGQYQSIKNELLRHPNITQVSATYAVPGRTGWQGQIVFPEGRASDGGLDVEYLAVDHDFIPTLGLQLLAGRNYSAEHRTDGDNALIINEAALQAFGWETPESAIGKRIDSPSGQPEGVVIGVVKDYHQHGLQEKINPVVFDLNPEVFQLFAIRTGSQDLGATLAHVESVWNNFFDGYPFAHFFLDEDFNRLYKNEERLARIFIVFSVLAILIACLGLFGLAAYATIQRSKEIGIRKVMGASVMHITLLLSKDFIKLVLIAFVLASPLAWLGIQRWLNNFAYPAPIGLDVFLIAGGAALLIAILTVSYQSIKTALANPIKSLRQE
jgi:putative ABC transport system permease protein